MKRATLLAALTAISSLAFHTAPALAQSGNSADSAALFLQINRVLSHPRCLNCHPKDDSPRQGMEQRVHSPPMTRGPRDHGPDGQPCAACHQVENYDASKVPGAPTWHLAPISMAWQDKSAGEICRAMLDRNRNGNKSLEATVRHLTEDKLVAWGWAPGVDVRGNPREPVPIPKAEFDRLVRAWAASGAACPD